MEYPREQRGAAADDIHIHHTRPDIDQRRRFILRHRIIDGVHILDRKRIHIHDHRRKTRALDKLSQFIDLVFLAATRITAMSVCLSPDRSAGNT